MSSFSIIVPCFNSSRFLPSLFSSLASQDYDPDNFECIFIDDNSSDSTHADLVAFQAKSSLSISVLQNHCPVFFGPGSCRNLGLRSATKDFILFLDSDDLLQPTALSDLDALIMSSMILPDVIPFDYYKIDENLHDLSNVNPQGHKSRKDFGCFENKSLLINSFLRMKMDGSVIFTCFRLRFLQDNQINFRHGIYEDIDFLFKCFAFSRSYVLLDKHIYIKRNCDGSIVNSFSYRHIFSYLEAWLKIFEFVQMEKTSIFSSIAPHSSLLQSFLVGFRGAIGVLLRMSQSSSKTGLQLHLTTQIIADYLSLQSPKLVLQLINTPRSDLSSSYDKLFVLVLDQWTSNDDACL